MGRSVSSEMSQMADFTEEMQSKVWRIMTESSHKYTPEQIVEIGSDVIDRAGHCLDEMFRLAG